MSESFDRLVAIMAKLRDPDGGCPWDVEQTFRTIAPYTIEEAYEVADAIERGDMADLRAELGDLLLQVVFHARMAEEDGHFDADAVADGIADKMIKRHPHVFAAEGDSGAIDDAAAQTLAWENQKAAERAERAAKHGREPSILDDVAVGLPALTRALKLQKRAARVGFDWADVRLVMEKHKEELGELEAELDGADPARLADEVGDLLFTCVNIARQLGIDPETALRDGNAKFERRFRQLEHDVKASGREPEAMSLDELEEAWQDAKTRV
ncbi:MAG: nucleoside triphosphate pyrophosphohydrolase [Rhodospirillales bacterium]